MSRPNRYGVTVTNLHDLRKPEPMVDDPSDRPRGSYVAPKGGTLVYVARDKRSHVLYVGMTDDLFGRMAAHTATSKWWEDMGSIQWEEWPDRVEARRRERQLIRRYRPPFNTSQKPADPSTIVHEINKQVRKQFDA